LRVIEMTYLYKRGWASSKRSATSFVVRMK
jgi:hypothetical protein